MTNTSHEAVATDCTRGDKDVYGHDGQWRVVRVNCGSLLE